MTFERIGYAIGSLIDRIAPVVWPWGEVRRLRAAVDDLKRLDIDHLDLKPGSMSMEARGRLVPFFAHALSEVMDAEGAPNCIEWEATHPTKGPLILSMRRAFGKTPMQLRNEALKQLGEAEAAAVLLRDAIRDHKRRVRESSPWVADEILWKVLGEEDSKDGRGRRRDHDLSPPDSVSQLGMGR